MYFFTFPTLQYLFAETLKCFKTSLIATIFFAVGYFLGSFISSTALGHRKSANQNPCHLYDICNMYFEAILCFYVLFNHLVDNSLFQLIRLSLDGNIKRYFAFTLVKLTSPASDKCCSVPLFLAVARKASWCIVWSKAIPRSCCRI